MNGIVITSLFCKIFLSVYAITQLYASLGSPLLPGWFPGGDPCGPISWQGVECVNENITAMYVSCFLVLNLVHGKSPLVLIEFIWFD